MFKKIRQKASGKNAKRGFTLTELLTALAIMSLVSIVILNGVQSASKIFVDATRASNSETLCVNIMKAVQKEVRNAASVEISDSGAVTLTSDTFGGEIAFESDSDGRIVITSGSGSYALLSDGSYPNNIKADCEMTGSKANGTVTITITTGPDLDNPVMSEQLVIKPICLM